MNMVSHHPASKGNSSRHGVILVLLVFLTVLFSGCFALPAPGSDPVAVLESNTSLVQTGDVSVVSQAGQVVKRIDGPQASIKDLLSHILPGFSVHTSTMFHNNVDMNRLMCNERGRDYEDLEWQRGDPTTLANMFKFHGTAWTRTVEQDCDLTHVAQALRYLLGDNPMAAVTRSHGGPNVCISWIQNKRFKRHPSPAWLKPMVSCLCFTFTSTSHALDTD